jgi:nucleotide-binding universal stress UspA family protein
MSMVPAELPPEYVPTLQKVLEGFIAGDAAGIESKAVLRESINHATGIAEHAQESKADLIVISTKGRTNLRYVILGSTAEQLLTRLPCSLLVVKPVTE